MNPTNWGLSVYHWAQLSLALQGIECPWYMIPAMCSSYKTRARFGSDLRSCLFLTVGKGGHEATLEDGVLKVGLAAGKGN